MSGDRDKHESMASLWKHFARRIGTVLAVTSVMAVSASACAPIPCGGGYADPNWCHDEFVGGGG
ncbi:MAG TPA: hypothetical protein VFG12_15090 [Rhodopila sp.]|jgi:hypothetical protein|nr:hypothetical protein [Rhodopila sp.]